MVHPPPTAGAPPPGGLGRPPRAHADARPPRRGGLGARARRRSPPRRRCARRWSPLSCLSTGVGGLAPKYADAEVSGGKCQKDVFKILLAKGCWVFLNRVAGLHRFPPFFWGRALPEGSQNPTVLLAQCGRGWIGACCETVGGKGSFSSSSPIEGVGDHSWGMAGSIPHPSLPSLSSLPPPSPCSSAVAGVQLRGVTLHHRPLIPEEVAAILADARGPVCLRPPFWSLWVDGDRSYLPQHPGPPFGLGPGSRTAPSGMAVWWEASRQAGCVLRCVCSWPAVVHVY